MPTIPGSDAATGPVGPPTAGAAPPGDRLGAMWPLREDQYEEVRKVGQGGMGAVTLVRDRRNGRLLCRKRPQELSDAVMARFVSEIRVLADNWCKDIVECIDFGRDESGPFLVMPYYRKGSLYQRVKDRGPLDGKAVVELAQAMGRALSHLHGKSILHRDIKPANILLSDDDQPVLADFGLVRVESGSTTLQHGGRFGTPVYMAPELQEGGEASPITDLYALGLTLRYAATGCAPGSGRDDEIPPHLRHVILRCTRPLPVQRHQSAADFLRDIEGLRDLRPTAAELQCPQCTAPIDRAARHCARCGTALFSRCEACGGLMRRGDRHCEKCGCSVETWRKALEQHELGKELLAEGRFAELQRLTAQLAGLTPGALRLVDEWRRRSAEVEARYQPLRRRALATERESGPRAAASLWRQILELCPDNAEALVNVTTVDAREPRFAFGRLRAEVDRSLANGLLDEAARLLGELRSRAANASEEGVVANLARRLANAEQEARDLRAATVEACLRAGDIQAAQTALQQARAAGLDADAATAFASRIRAIRSAIWRRDLLLTAGVVVAIGALLGGVVAYRDRGFALSAAPEPEMQG